MKNICLIVLLFIGSVGLGQSFEVKSLLSHTADTVYDEGVRYILRSNHPRELELLKLMRNSIKNDSVIEAPAEYEDLFDEVMVARLRFGEGRTFGTGICIELLYATNLADINENDKNRNYIINLSKNMVICKIIKTQREEVVLKKADIVVPIITNMGDIGEIFYHYVYILERLNDSLYVIIEQNVIEGDYTYRLALSDTVKINGLYKNKLLCYAHKIIIFAIENKIYKLIWKQKDMQPQASPVSNIEREK